MLDNSRFFREVWPHIAPVVTSHRAGAYDDILPLLHRLKVRPPARVLDVPCGYGRHVVALARRGYRVTGVDISAPLLAEARKAAATDSLNVDFHRADMRRLGFRSEFDLVLNLFTSFGYFGDAQDQRVLENFSRALRPGGWLVIHVINRDWVIRNLRPRIRSRLGKGFQLEERGAFELSRSVIRSEWTARRGRQCWRGVVRLRMYSCHELAGKLRAADFREITPYGGFRGEPLTIDCRWQVLVARRP